MGSQGVTVEAVSKSGEQGPGQSAKRKRGRSAPSGGGAPGEASGAQEGNIGTASGAPGAPRAFLLVKRPEGGLLRGAVELPSVVVEGGSRADEGAGGKKGAGPVESCSLGCPGGSTELCLWEHGGSWAGSGQPKESRRCFTFTPQLGRQRAAGGAGRRAAVGAGTGAVVAGGWWRGGR